MSVFNIDEIRSIEKVKAVKNPEWYYHGFKYSHLDFLNMVTDGLKCPLVVNKRISFGYNGCLFISLSKINPESHNSSFGCYLENCPMFIIDDIKALKCYPAKCAPIPILTRDSLWDDEYQAFFKIPANKIIGIQSTIERWAVRDEIDYLKNVRDMITDLEGLGLDLPIYDYTHHRDDQIFEVDKQGYLDLTKKLV